MESAPREALAKDQPAPACTVCARAGAARGPERARQRNSGIILGLMANACYDGALRPVQAGAPCPGTAMPGVARIVSSGDTWQNVAMAKAYAVFSASSRS
jgi:hypothetical protein